jgi:hypothetical protein
MRLTTNPNAAVTGAGLELEPGDELRGGHDVVARDQNACCP